MNQTLEQYIESEIIPRYAFFDKAHQIDHARTVISQSLELAKHYDVNEDMVYAIAAYHDTGLAEGRDVHHTASARIIRTDARLAEWSLRNRSGQWRMPPKTTAPQTKTNRAQYTAAS